MFGAAPPVSLPNLPPLPGLPADIFQQAQQQQDKVLNLHLQRHRAMEEATRENAKENRLKQTRFVIYITISTFIFIETFVHPKISLSNFRIKK